MPPAELGLIMVDIFDRRTNRNDDLVRNSRDGARATAPRVGLRGQVYL